MQNTNLGEMFQVITDEMAKENEIKREKFEKRKELEAGDVFNSFTMKNHAKQSNVYFDLRELIKLEVKLDDKNKDCVFNTYEKYGEKNAERYVENFISLKYDIELYRIPFTSVYISKEDDGFHLYAKQIKIINNELCRIPVIDNLYEAFDKTYDLIRITKDMIKCSTIYNEDDNFLNVGYTNEELFKIAKNKTMNLEHLANYYGLTFTDIYGKDFKSNIIIEEDEIYFKSPIIVNKNKQFFGKVYFSVGKNKSKQEFEDSVFVLEDRTETEDFYQLHYFKIKDGIFLCFEQLYSIAFTFDGRLKMDDKNHLYNIFKCLVPNWEYGKDFVNIFNNNENNFTPNNVSWC